MVICLQRCANDLRVVQLMPLPPITSCSSKTHNGLPFWCWLTQIVLEKRPLNGCRSSKSTEQQHHRSTQPCIPPGSLNRAPALAGVKAKMSPLSGGR